MNDERAAPKSIYASTVRLLAYNPLPAANSLAEQSIRQRTALGLSQKEAAGRIGVDPGPLAKWERGERVPASGFLERVKRLLEEEERRASSRRVG